MKRRNHTLGTVSTELANKPNYIPSAMESIKVLESYINNEKAVPTVAVTGKRDTENPFP